MRMTDWVRIPTGWIRDQSRPGLVAFRWSRAEGAADLAALMLYIVILHRVGQVDERHQQDGLALSYGEMETASDLSRPLISKGLRVLESRGLITSAGPHRGTVRTYKVSGFPVHSGWAKLPAKRLYSSDGVITAFRHVKLRSRVELHAIKLYLLLIAMRDVRTNLARISYPVIETYIAVPTNDLKAAISWLVAHELIRVESVASVQNSFGVSNAYRIAHIESRRHMGTTLRGEMEGAPG